MGGRSPKYWKVLPNSDAGKENQSLSLNDKLAALKERIDDYHDELRSEGGMRAKWSCNVVRGKITRFLSTKEMTQTAFRKEIGDVSASSFLNFMKRKGTWDGSHLQTFWGATQFFMKKEQLDKFKKANTSSIDKNKEANSKKEKLKEGRRLCEQIQNFQGPPLKVNDRDGRVCVFEDCDAVRRRIFDWLNEGYLTKAAFCRELNPSHPINNKVRKWNLGFPLQHALFRIVLHE